MSLQFDERLVYGTRFATRYPESGMLLGERLHCETARHSSILDRLHFGGIGSLVSLQLSDHKSAICVKSEDIQPIVWHRPGTAPPAIEFEGHYLHPRASDVRVKVVTFEFDRW